MREQGRRDLVRDGQKVTHRRSHYRPMIRVFSLGLLVFLGCDRPTPSIPPQQVFASKLLRAGIASDDPWAQAHLLLAFSADSQLDEARDRWSTWIKDLDSSIPLHGEDGERGEQHPHLMLRTAAWVLPSTHPRLVERVQSALASIRSPSHWKQINDLAWLVEAAAVLKLPATTATADADLQGLAATLLDALETSDQLVQRCVDDGVERPDGSADPSQSGTWAYTCGGFHLLSALVESVEAGYLVGADRQRVVDRLLLLARRIPWELQFRVAQEQRAVSVGISPRRAARHAVLARMKLAGHGLDVLGRSRAVGVLTLEQAAKAAQSCRNASKQIFARFLMEVDPQGLLLSPQTEAVDPQTWERAFGDGCHLLRGLAVWYSVSQK